MRNETLFERLGIEYQEVGDILYPLLSVETEDLSQPVGKYGDMWIGYLKEKFLYLKEKYDNITLVENFTMVDLICEDNLCKGIIGHDAKGKYHSICADYTVLATGGIGGLFRHSTNYRHLTGDALALALKYNIKLRNIDYIQIHPTSLYTKKKGRKFLISESVRGEGAILINAKGERFVNELLPRDVVANAIFEEMKKEGSDYVRLSLAPIEKEEILSHFPNIYRHCLEEGYDITKEPIPVVPSQHYFMGGIDVDSSSKTSMDRIYAVGETACTGLHGANRLASNSLLEALVVSRFAAASINEGSVVIIVDNSPSAMIIPTGIFDFLQDPNDFYFPP